MFFSLYCLSYQYFCSELQHLKFFFLLISLDTSAYNNYLHNFCMTASVIPFVNKLLPFFPSYFHFLQHTPAEPNKPPFTLPHCIYVILLSHHCIHKLIINLLLMLFAKACQCSFSLNKQCKPQIQDFPAAAATMSGTHRR